MHAYLCNLWTIYSISHGSNEFSTAKSYGSRYQVPIATVELNLRFRVYYRRTHPDREWDQRSPMGPQAPAAWSWAWDRLATGHHRSSAWALELAPAGACRCLRRLHCRRRKSNSNYAAYPFSEQFAGSFQQTAHRHLSHPYSAFLGPDFFSSF